MKAIILILKMVFTCTIASAKEGQVGNGGLTDSESKDEKSEKMSREKLVYNIGLLKFLNVHNPATKK